jgi:predicted  nucleic acid-binding Zn-ribbon protein
MRSDPLNPNYEILEKILRLDGEAGAATMNWRSAQGELARLAQKTKASEDLIAKTRTDLLFLESELRRHCRRVDELEERKTERSAKLYGARNDEEHRTFKREVDHIERDIRETTRKAEDTEAQIERLKGTFFTAEDALAQALSATSEERQKAELAQNASSGKLDEIEQVRNQHLSRLDDHIEQHYRRVAQISRNPNGPVTRVIEKACGNCHMGLSPQLVNLVLRGQDVQFCPSCNHILLPATN